MRLDPVAPGARVRLTDAGAAAPRGAPSKDAALRAAREARPIGWTSCRRRCTRRGGGRCSSCCRGGIPRARTARSGRSSGRSIPRASSSPASRRPPPLELAHDFLWRVHQAVPPRGTIGIFNRSHYEDVLVVRVHGLVPESVWRAALRADQHVRAHPHRERRHHPQVLPAHLPGGAARAPAGAAGGSREVLEVLGWRLGRARQVGRVHRGVRGGAARGPAPPAAPWYVVPADKKYLRDLLVAQVVAETLERMDPKYPGPPKDLGAFRRALR